METRTNVITFNDEQVKQGLLTDFIDLMIKMNSLEYNNSHWEILISNCAEYTTVEFQESVANEGQFVWIESEEEAYALEDVQENQNARYEINPEMLYSIPNKDNELTKISGSEILKLIQEKK